MPTAREEQRAFFDERIAALDAESPGYGAAWRAFCDMVLRHGGDFVVPSPQVDPFIEFYATSGTLVPDETEIVLIPGDDSECHENTVALWRSGQAVAIGTGYALSDDALWRRHSWAWGADGRLLETTELRERYFGLLFEGEGTVLIAEWLAPSATDDE